MAGAVASTVDDEFFTSKEFAFQPQTQQHPKIVPNFPVCF
jgi:hypothetical protein